MFQKESFTIPSDSSGILLVRIIEIRRCSSRKLAKVGKFLKIVKVRFAIILFLKRGIQVPNAFKTK